MKLHFDSIIQAMVTEKSSQLEAKFNDFTLLVDRDCTKPQIRDAVEAAFGVRALSVRTLVFRKKAKRNRHTTTSPKVFKKAILRLPEGQRLEMK